MIKTIFLFTLPLIAFTYGIFYDRNCIAMNCPHCLYGYTGEIFCENERTCLQCKIRCLYGAGCLWECGHCVNGEQCDRSNGTCYNGCEAGYYTTMKCEKECDDYSYGRNCSQLCGYCQNGVPCNKKTGWCPSGCASGYEGNYCNKPCGYNTYGARCSKKCGHCVNGEQCDNVSGNCRNGCEAGYYTTMMCEKACDIGSYGYDCNETCGHCHDVNQCSDINGTCLTGCDANYQGDLCKTRSKRKKKQKGSKNIWRKKDNREELERRMWREAQVVVSDRRIWRPLLHGLSRASSGHGGDKGQLEKRLCC